MSSKQSPAESDWFTLASMIFIPGASIRDALTISGGKRAPRPTVSTGQPRTSGVCPEGDIQRQVHEAPLMREVEVPSAAPGTDATFEVPVEFQDGKIVIDVRAAEEQANAIPGQVNTIRESGRLPGGNDVATSFVHLYRLAALIIDAELPEDGVHRTSPSRQCHRDEEDDGGTPPPGAHMLFQLEK